MGFLYPSAPTPVVAPAVAGVRIQTSAYALPIPLVWGTNRLAINLLWYGDFNTVAVQQGGGGGGGKGGPSGGGGGSIVYYYYASFAMAICEGPISGIERVWASKAVTTPAALGMSEFLGTYPQTPWDYLVTNHPDEALAYAGLAYVALANAQLDNGAQLPNYTIEVSGRLLFNSEGPDANLAEVLLEALTDENFGAGFPASGIGDWDQWYDYCAAAGLLFSPTLTNSEQMSGIVQRWMEITNSEAFFSEGVLKITPRGDATITGNGVTFVPDLTPLFDFDDDDFLYEDGEDPVKLTVLDPSDVYNVVKVEFNNRDNYYNPQTAEAKDQAAIDDYGLRPESSQKYSEIADPEVAQKVAQIRLQRYQNTRNIYTFKLPLRYCMLEQMDLVTITDDELGLDRQLVRILDISETETGELEVKAEEMTVGTASPAVYGTQEVAGYNADYNVAPDPVSAPAFGEAPVELTSTGLAVLVAVNGSGPQWGGCDVWISYDGDSYKRLGNIAAGSRYGTVSAPVDANTDSVVEVQLAGMARTLLSGSNVDADNLATLCLIGNEYVAYTDATLLAENNYSLKLRQRGAYNTVPAAHSIGEKFIRVDSAVLQSESLPLSFIGSTIYFKFLSYNMFGGGMQALDDVLAYPYNITGVMAALPPSDVSSFNAEPNSDKGGTLLYWTPVPEPDTQTYEIREGASWAAGTVLTQVNATHYTIPTLPVGTYKFWIKAIDALGNYSQNALSVDFSIVVPEAPVITAAFAGYNYRLTWPVPATMFQIDHYEIRYGSSWGAGTLVGTSKTTVFEAPALWGGSRTFWVAAVDSAGNVGNAGSASMTVIAPSVPTVTASVIVNNVRFEWSDAQQTLPMKHYEIRRGSSYDTADVVGFVLARFTVLFEASAGTYRYWVVGVDSAGNYGTPGSTTVNVAGPSNFVLLDNFDSVFDGMKTNCKRERGTYYVIEVNKADFQYLRSNADNMPSFESALTGYSVEQWFKIPETPGVSDYQILWAKNVDGNITGDGMVMGAGLFESSGSTILEFWHTKTTGLTWKGVQVNMTPYVGQMVHICCRWNGTAFAVLVNGVALSTTPVGTGAASDAPMVGAGKFFFGYAEDTASWATYLSGQLGPARVYTRALTDVEVAEHYNDIFKSNSNLAAKWEFPEGSGDVAEDGTEYANVLQLMSVPDWIQSVLDGQRSHTIEAMSLLVPVEITYTFAEHFINGDL